MAKQQDTQVNVGFVLPSYTDADAKQHQEKVKNEEIQKKDFMQRNNDEPTDIRIQQGLPVNNGQIIQENIVLDEEDIEKLQIMMAFSEKTVRKAFARKVFAILALLLLKTFSFIALSVYYEPLRKFWNDNILATLYALPVYFITAFTIICVKSVRRTWPWNYIVLFLFSSSLAYMVGGMSALFRGTTVLIAFGMTVFLVSSLIIFACQTRWDFTGWRMFGFSSVILLSMAIVSSLVWLSRAGEIALATLGIFVFSMLLIYDVQLIISGSHKYKISPEEHVFAVTILYLDIMNIFINILRLIR